MGKSAYIVFLFTLSFNISLAQNDSLSNFIPNGYKLYESVLGDLNDDGLNDCVLIIKKTDSSKIVTNRFEQKVDRNRRGILVLLNIEGSYKLIVKNVECFSSENEDGGIYYAPEFRITIVNQDLLLHYQHGRYGFWEYKFRLIDSHFNLIEYNSSSNFGPIVNSETTINFLTKKKLIRKNINENDEGGDEVFEENWSDIEIKLLIKISEIKDFDELDVNIY